ncbi:MAG: DUF6935 domain-containing protein [Eubacterium sp.]
MGLFDSQTTGSNRTERVVFSVLPDDLQQFKAMPQASLSSPFETAAMTVLALCFYPKDRDDSLAMLEYLRGPRPMNNADKQFIADRFRGKDYVPRSYFLGATPDNDYSPSQPYSIEISENPYTYSEQGFAKLFITCGGADSPRPIKLRLAKDGKWYLWEQALLTDVRHPESTNPWA